MHALWLYSTAVLIWGSSWFAITFQIGVIDESVTVFYRFLLAGLIMLVFCLIARRRLKFSVQEHAFIALQGACLFSINYVLIYFGTAYIPSGLVAVAFSTLIIMNIFNGMLFLKKPIKLSVLAGALIGLTGIAMVFGHEISVARESANTANVWKGLAFVLVATYFASLGNILSARNQSNGLPVLQTNAYGALYGSLIMLLYSLTTGAEFNVDWSVEYVGSLLFLTVFGTIVAFWAYLNLVGQIGADKAAYAMVLFPIVALGISTLFEGFVWSPTAVAGVALVLMGNIAILGGRQLLRWFGKAG